MRLLLALLLFFNCFSVSGAENCAESLASTASILRWSAVPLCLTLVCCAQAAYHLDYADLLTFNIDILNDAHEYNKDNTIDQKKVPELYAFYEKLQKKYMRTELKLAQVAKALDDLGRGPKNAQACLELGNAIALEAQYESLHVNYLRDVFFKGGSIP